jgi:DNA helicase MCM8
MAIDQEQSGGNNMPPPGRGGGAAGSSSGRGGRGRFRGSNFYQKKAQTLFLLYVFANNVTTARDGMSTSSPLQSLSLSSSSSNIIALNSSSFLLKEIQLIHKIIYRPNLFDFLCNSLAPNIYGHHIIKKAFILALFGGTQRLSRTNSKDKDSSSSLSVAIPIRSSIHVLVVGDPGMGKSQMLRAVASVTPRGFFLIFLFYYYCSLSYSLGVYVCGNTSTSSGLTVTVVKEGGDFALEAGLLFCCFVFYI